MREEVTGIHWWIDGVKGKMKKDEKAKYEKTQMRRKYEKAEEMEKRRRSIEDGCGKK